MSVVEQNVAEGALSEVMGPLIALPGTGLKNAGVCSRTLNISGVEWVAARDD